MNKRVLAFLPVVGVIGAAAAITFSGCGNSWLDTKDRNKTPAALMFDGQKAYDQENYELAASLFSQAVAKDPTNISARIGWSFALNGQAGLSLTEIMQNIIKEANPTPALTGTGITSFTNIVGLKAAEMTSLKAALGDIALYAAEATEIRANSNKLAKLNESWQAICPVLPATVYTNFPSDANELFAKATTCSKTIDTANNAALFAAAIGLFAQAASLYQMLDANGDNDIDIVADVQTKFTNLAGAGNTASSITAINSALSTVNAALSSELIPWTLATFKVLQSAVGSIEGLPQSVEDQINESTSKLDSATKTLASYKASAGTPKLGTAGGELATKLNANKTQIDTAVDNAFNSGTAEQKAQALEACANWDAIVIAGGLGSNVTRPASCPPPNLNLAPANLVPAQNAPAQKTTLTVPAVNLHQEPVSPEKRDSMYLSLIEFFQLAESSRH
jgi:hypothetical protein